MGLEYVNLTGYKRGIPAAETGINCSKFTLELEPEINEFLPGLDGQAIGKAVGDTMGKLSIEGEIKDATGIMAVVAKTAFVPGNTTAFFGRTGGWYWARGTITYDRGEWSSVSMEFDSRAGIL